MVEEQGRLDQLELHDAERAFVVGNDVHAGVSRVGRGRLGGGQRTARGPRLSTAPQGAGDSVAMMECILVDRYKKYSYLRLS